ncbi:hypothetical protein [Paraconexibacter sp.]|uniref:hypothetical protein n=1 Tax=Paraconexibacter sp. TaxID=2949640 RepID=UPI00356145CA
MPGFLTIQPFRGDQVAAGAVALTVLVGVLDLRLRGEVGDAGRLAIVAVAVAFVSTLAWRSPWEASSPRGYQVALIVCAWALSLLTALEVAALLDAEADATTVTWIAAATTAVAAAWARARDTATLTLLASLAGLVTVVAGAQALGDPSDTTIRWLLFLAAIVLALAALARRDRRPQHAAQMANAGGLAVAAILVSGFPDVFAVLAALGEPDEVAGALGTGWELVGLAAGFGLVAYGAVDEHRGPTAVGVLVLVLWTVGTGSAGGLVGWPLLLALAAGFLLTVGLRPSTPLPPPPGPPDLPDEPLPLPWRERR